MNPIKVVCGIIWKDGKVLIAKRKLHKSMGGFWEFPGGKLELNESAEAALVRELYEEMGMQVQVNEFFGSQIHAYEKFTVELMAYQCSFLNASFLLSDHDEVLFVNPNELVNYKIAPADMFIVDQLQ